MQRRWLILMALVVGGSACAEDAQTERNGDPSAQNEDAVLGGLSLSLRSVDSQYPGPYPFF